MSLCDICVPLYWLLSTDLKGFNVGIDIAIYKRAIK